MRDSFFLATFQVYEFKSILIWLFDIFHQKEGGKGEVLNFGVLTRQHNARDSPRLIDTLDKQRMVQSQ